MILFTIYYKLKYINIYHILPYKHVSNKNIKKIMIGLPTIDRDSDLLEEVYNNIINSIKYCNKTNNFEFMLFPICRKIDKKCYDFWNNKKEINNSISDVYLVDSYEIKKRHNFNQMAKTFNIILNNARNNNSDALIIIESDIIIKENTILLLINNIKNSHVALCYLIYLGVEYPLYQNIIYFIN